MELSNISRVITPTLSRQLFMMAKQYNDVIDFTLGDPDIPTPMPICEAAFQAVANGNTRYAPNAGLPDLREAIALATKEEYGIAYSSSNVAVTMGATEAIYLAFNAILNKGDEVIILAPYWIQYENIVRLFQAKPVIIDKFAKEFEPDISALKSAITSKTKVIVINNPNNPSGYVYSDFFLKEIAKIAKENDICIFADEVYRTLIYSNHSPNIAAFCPRENLVLFNSFSKQFAMTGWRVGYVVAEEEFINTIIKIQQNVAVCVGTPNQFAAIKALEHKIEYSSAIRNSFSKRREVFLREMLTIPKLSILAPEGTFYAFVNIEKTGMDSKTFCFSLLGKKHVAAIPGIAFGSAFDNYIRLAFTLNEDLIVKGIKRINQFVQSL